MSVRPERFESWIIKNPTDEVNRMAERFSSVGNFYVKDKAGNYYPATFLVDPNGAPVVDSVLARGLQPPYSPQQLTLYADKQGTVYPNPHNYLVVPSADYMNELVNRGQ